MNTYTYTMNTVMKIEDVSSASVVSSAASTGGMMFNRNHHHHQHHHNNHQHHRHHHHMNNGVQHHLQHHLHDHSMLHTAHHHHADIDDVALPEVNFNAADEFNLKFFDTSAATTAAVIDETGFSSDELGEPASVDSQHGVVSPVPSSSTAPPPPPPPSAADVLQMVTSVEADELGDWMESFVHEQQQRQELQQATVATTTTTTVTTTSDYVMGVKEEIYSGGFPTTNCANLLDRVHDRTKVSVGDSRSVHIKIENGSAGGTTHTFSIKFVFIKI